MKTVLKDCEFPIEMMMLNILYTLLVSGTFNQKISIDLFNTGISFAYIVSLVTIYREKRGNINDLYKYLICGLLGLEVMVFLYQAILRIGTSEINQQLCLAKIYFIKSLLEPMVLIWVFKNYKKVTDNNSLIKILCISIAVTLVVMMGISFKMIYILKEPLPNALIQFLEAGLYYYVLTMIEKDKAGINEYAIKDLKYYIGIVIVSRLLSVFAINGASSNYIFFVFSLVEFAKYFLVKIILVEVINFPKEILYKDLNDKNREIQRMNKVLSEIKTNLQDMSKSNAELMKNIPCGLAVLEGSRIVYVNDRIKELFNIKNNDEIKGKTIYDISNKEYHEVIRRKINDKADGLCGNYHNYKCTFNNTEVCGEVVCLKLKNLGKNKVICLFCDSTEKKRLKSVEELLQKREKEEKLKNDFLTNLSHEFKTPVNVIYSAVQIQKLKEDKGQFEEILKYNDIIKQNCNRLTRLINNFIDTTRLSAANTKANLNPINIVQFVEDITMSVVAFAEEKGIEVVFDTNEEEIIAEVDNALIDRAILNIISNAIKYNRKNGHINVILNGKSDTVEIIVEDNGIGISDEKKATIFNRFERENRSTSPSRERDGSGLGLNIVKEIVKLHNGSIRLDSKENVGTKITIEIPRADHDLQESDKVYYSNDYDENMRYNLELEMSDISIK